MPYFYASGSSKSRQNSDDELGPQYPNSAKFYRKLFWIIDHGPSSVIVDHFNFFSLLDHTQITEKSTNYQSDLNNGPWFIIQLLFRDYVSDNKPW